MAASRKIERVFLLFPPVRLCRETMKVASSPLGVGYLAAALRDTAEVRIMDAAVESEHAHYLGDDFTWYGSTLDEIRDRIAAFQPDLVGIACIFSSVFPVVREVCRMVKRLDPGIVTITGGSYPAFLPAHCLEEPALDLVALGEGEETLREVVERLRSGRPLAEVDGLAFRDGERVVVNPKTRWIENLDTIPFPARDLLPMARYKKVGVPHSLSSPSPNYAPLITSRGCPAHCIYCSSTRFWGNRYRFRSAANVLDEIGELVSRWGIEEIQFEDDNLTANRQRARAIFEGIIERGYRLRFNFPNGVALWTLDPPLVDLMQRAGCYEMTLAFESGSQEVLSRIVKKPTNLAKAAQTCAYIRQSGIRTDAFYIIGFPGETRAQIQETFRFANAMKTDMAYFFVANPLPGTELYQMARERGLLRDDVNVENLSYSRSAYNESAFPQGELEKMAGREFVLYAFRSFLRHPLTFLKRVIFELFLKRPRYTLGIMVRIWRRNIRRRK